MVSGDAQRGLARGRRPPSRGFAGARRLLDSAHTRVHTHNALERLRGQAQPSRQHAQTTPAWLRAYAFTHAPARTHARTRAGRRTVTRSRGCNSHARTHTRAHAHLCGPWSASHRGASPVSSLSSTLNTARCRICRTKNTPTELPCRKRLSLISFIQLRLRPCFSFCYPF
jgi:hypothetical protein